MTDPADAADPTEAADPTDTFFVNLKNRYDEGVKQLGSKWDSASSRIFLNSDPHSFAQLVAGEENLLKRARYSNGQLRHAHRAVVPQEDPPDDSEELVIAGKASSEPWVSFRQADRFGLALSGGGIRSATFNLGLLEAMARPLTKDQDSLLAQVDYLSTVSGGGYVGGFWSRWRRDQRDRAGVVQEDTPVFPQHGLAAGISPQAPEPRPIRHMRERSRFLMPRVGIFHSDTWAGVIAVMGATLPSLVVAVAILAVAWLTWLGAAYLLFWPLVGPSVLVTGSFIVQVVTEQNWARSKYGTGTTKGYLATAYATSLLMGLGWALYLPSFVKLLEFDDPGGVTSHAWLFSADTPWWIFGVPAVPWLCMTIALLLFRAVASRLLPNHAIAVLERVASRCLAPGLAWLVFGGLWAAAFAFERASALPTATAGTLGVGALFVSIRQWLTEPLTETRGSKLADRVVGLLKPVLPPVLAYAAVLGAMVVVAFVLFELGRAPAVNIGGWWFALIWSGAAAGLGIIAYTWVAVNPDRLGLHAFYRARIRKTFLGAACDHTEVPEDEHAEVMIHRLDGQRPIHLVCCTGNDLASDPLDTLYRGGRSVVLSPAAVCVGNDAARYSNLPLSAALTASAAAFNSQMGSFSMRLGPAVGFLMTALGLRLGLWMPHPLEGVQRRMFPGAYLLREMFGMSHARTQRSTWSSAPSADDHHGLHLSDGGHFENLGLYELIRRHCRYVLVSDCGADPHLAFDDLATAIRLVREDFGVEIELDVSPLRPGEDGLSKQHVVVGTIHYGGVQGIDKGILIYFKPTLVGDEPPDVAQYQTHNAEFPHEGTSDQFYDESQWESYRRLGQHSAGVVFGFASENGFADRPKPIEWVFSESVERWQRLRDVDSEQMGQLRRERDDVLAQIRRHAPESFRAELFTEAAQSLGISHGAKPISAEDHLDILYHCAALASLMERVWLAGRLEIFWTHPANRPWMSLFGQVAASPSFQRWWVLLRPSFSDGFNDFMKQRLGLRIKGGRPGDPKKAPAHLTIDSAVALGMKKEPLFERWVKRTKCKVPHADLSFLTYTMAWPNLNATPVMVGILAYTWDDINNTAAWSTADLYVPMGLDGAGIVSRFLDDAIKKLPVEHAVGKVNLVVTVDDPDATSAGDGRPALADPAHRHARLQLTHFYKSRDFIQCKDGKLRMVLDAPVPTATPGVQPPP